MFRYTLLLSDFVLTIIKMFTYDSEKLKSSVTKSSQLLLPTAIFQANSQTVVNTCQRDHSDESSAKIEDLQESTRKVKKSVDFSKIVRVCLIPCRSEFEPVKSCLWWTSVEINCFKGEAFQQLKKVIATHRCTLKEGLAILYSDSDGVVAVEY